MPRSRPEIPQDRLIILRQQSESADFVLGPGTDVRRREIPHVVHVEAQQRSHFGLRQQRLCAGQPLAAQPVKIDALLPIHRHGPVRLQCHNTPPIEGPPSPLLTLARTTRAPPETPTLRSAPSHLPMAAKTEWARASRPFVSPVPLNCRKRRRRSPPRSPL